MPVIVRCPSCGALWRLPAHASAHLRCSECGASFEAERAESVELSEEALARLREKSAAKAAPAPEPAQAEPEPQIEPETEPETEARDADDETPRSRAWLAALCVAGFVALVAVGGAVFNGPILSAAPWLRPVYEGYCGAVPCPGFVWSQPKAFEVSADVGDMVDTKVSVTLTLTNTSEHPQEIPLVEVRLLDAAGDTLAQRLLEPAELGFAREDFVAAHGGAQVKASIPIPNGMPITSASARAVTPL